MHTVLSFSKDHLSYWQLKAVLVKAYRNGNWGKLTCLERALYRASLELARLRKKIVNRLLLSLLHRIIGKLLRKFSDEILELGRRKAEELKKMYQKSRLLPSCSLEFFEDKDYLFWLGNREVLFKNLGNLIGSIRLMENQNEGGINVYNK
jgi:hypothetical protein